MAIVRDNDLKPAAQRQENYLKARMNRYNQKNRGYAVKRNPLKFMVGQGRIELPTPGFSVQCSTD